MSLIDTNYHVYDNSEIKSFSDHRVNVSLVGQKDQDEKKQNTLQDEAVTLSYNTESQHSFNANNKKLPKALRAYLENQPSTVKEDENKDYALPDPIFNKDDDKGVTEEDKKTEIADPDILGNQAKAEIHSEDKTMEHEKLGLPKHTTANDKTKYVDDPVKHKVKILKRVSFSLCILFI